MTIPTPPKRKSRLSRRQRRQLTVMSIVMGGLLVIVLLIAIAQPPFIEALLPPTPTIFVLNPSATPDPRISPPPTWTPSNTPRPGPSVTPSITPSITTSPTPFPTPLPTLTFTPYATPDRGWFETEVRDAFFALQFPNTWLPTTLIGRDPSVALTEIAQRDPLRAESIRDSLGQVVLDDLVFLAFDTATYDDVYVNNILAAFGPPADETSIDEIRDRNLIAYDGSDFYEVVSSDSTTIDGRPARRIRYTTEFATEEGSITIYHLEIIAENRRTDDPIMIFTFSTSESRRNIYEGLFDRIASTIRYTRRVSAGAPTLTPTRDRTLVPDTPTVTLTPSNTPEPTTELDAAEGTTEAEVTETPEP